MATAWRIVRQKQAGTAFTGEGAAKYGGRWNSRGVRVVYSSGAISLAALETLVHLNPVAHFRYVAYRIEFDERLVDRAPVVRLPPDWQAEPPSPSTKAIGDLWVRDARTAVLSVPSVLIPGEPNYLLNPLHPDFAKIRMGKPEKFAFDPRLLPE